LFLIIYLYLSAYIISNLHKRLGEWYINHITEMFVWHERVKKE